jgi:hypothetical protein
MEWYVWATATLTENLAKSQLGGKGARKTYKRREMTQTVLTIDSEHANALYIRCTQSPFMQMCIAQQSERKTPSQDPIQRQLTRPGS